MSQDACCLAICLFRLYHIIIIIIIIIIIQEFMYRDATNVEPEIYDYTSNNWSHWNSNEKLNP